MSDTDLDLIWAAWNGERGSDQERIARVFVAGAALCLRKNEAYGSSAWKAPVLAPGLDVGTAILVRMSDKVERLNSLLGDSRRDSGDEPIEDTLHDLVNYGLLYLARPTRSSS